MENKTISAFQLCNPLEKLLYGSWTAPAYVAHACLPVYQD